MKNFFINLNRIVAHASALALVIIGQGIESLAVIGTDPNVLAAEPAIQKLIPAMGPLHTVGIVITFSGPVLALVRAAIQAKANRPQ